MNTTQSAAALFLHAASTHGFSVAIKSDSVVSISKAFAPGDLAAFSACDCYGTLLLDMVPLKGGSVWGTDGGSVGGHAAVKSGRYTLNKSGSGKRFVKALIAAMHEMMEAAS